MPSPALQALGIGNPVDLGTRYKTASDTLEGANAKLSTALQTKETEMAPVEARIKDANATAPAPPKLEAIKDTFEHKGFSKEELGQNLSTMMAFAAIGGLMTRQPMTAALNSFSKGMDGLVKGDQIVFQREKDAFDRNLKTAIAKNSQAAEEYKMAAEKHKGDLAGMMNEWRLIAAKHKDTVGMAHMEAQNAQSMMQHIEGLVKMDEAARRGDQQFGIMMKRMDEQMRHNQATERASFERNVIKDKAIGQGGKPTQQDRQHYMDNNQLVKSIDRIGTMLNDPATRQKIDDARVGNFLSDSIESKAIQQFLIRPNLDPVVKTYLNEVANLRNQYFLDMSGKAVTAGEALRNYGAVVSPQDTASDVLNKMSVARVRAGEKMRDLETYFPSLGAIRAPGAGGGASGVGRRAGELAPTNAKGWALHEDAQGRKAYVGPGGEIEAVQ